jgi:hypothetical protein
MINNLCFLLPGKTASQNIFPLVFIPQIAVGHHSKILLKPLTGKGFKRHYTV